MPHPYNFLYVLFCTGKKYSSYKGMKHARVESTSPMIQEDQPQRKESNIYASLTLGGKVVYPTHPDDAVVFYWNENYRAPPLKPSSLKHCLKEVCD